MYVMSNIAYKLIKNHYLVTIVGIYFPPIFSPLCEEQVLQTGIIIYAEGSKLINHI